MDSRGMPVMSSGNRSESIWLPEFLLSLALVDVLGIDATFSAQEEEAVKLVGVFRQAFHDLWTGLRLLRCAESRQRQGLTVAGAP
jgi:hypothetical protein